MEQRLKSHYESLARVVWFTRMADFKAAPIIALQAALIGALATRADELWAIVKEYEWGWERGSVIGLLVIYGASFLAAVLLAGLVYMPRNPKTGKGILIYFEDISNMKFEQFAAQARQMRPETIERQLLQQIHAVSKVASTKMRWVGLAIWASGLSLLLWVALMALGNIWQLPHPN